MTALDLRLRDVEVCPLCGSVDLPVCVRTRDHETGSGDFQVLSCAGCGAGVTAPQPLEEEIPKLYERRDTADFPRTGRLSGGVRRLGVRRQIRKLLHRLDSGSYRALDVGCGDGLFARLLSEEPGCVSVIATDFHPSTPPELLAAPRAEYVPYDGLGPGHGPFDLVFARQVLEHQSDPRAFVAEQRGRLAPGGRLVIEVPNFRSVWRSLFGGYWSGLYVPRHLFHFTPTSIRPLFEGLEIVSITPTHLPLIGQSLGYLLRLPIGNLGLPGLAFYPLQVALDAVCGRSASMRVVARRD